MSLSVDVLTPVLDATPGATSHGRLLLHNLASSETTFTVQVVGLGAAPPAAGPPTASVITLSVPGRSSDECLVPVTVPVDLAAGQHAAAFQITSTRSADRPVLAQFTVAVESIEGLSLDVTPSPVRGRRRASFVLGLSNGEPNPIAFTLDAESTEAQVWFKTPAFRLLPGEHATTKAKVKGPRHLLGETQQHNLLISAHGKAASTSITAPFIQKPVFAHKFRAVIAGLAVIALWLAAIGGVALWLSNRSDSATDEEIAAAAGDAALVQLTDANGDPLDNGPYTVQADGTIVDAGGNPVEGFAVDENGNVVDENGNPINGVEVDPETNTLVDENDTPIGLPGGTGGVPGSGDGTSGAGGDGTTVQVQTGDGTGDDAPVSGLVVPTSTRLRGTIDVGGADLSDVTVRLSPLDLGEQPPADATVVDDGSSASPDQTSATKIWSARFAPAEIGLGSYRQTEPVPPLEVTPGIDGVWQFSDVQIRRTYELSFSKPGYDTQAFVISPPDDGSDVELDVVLKPARGVISGRVVDNGAPLGGVEVTLSDGTLTFSTTSATDGDVGAFSFDSVSTPGVYTLVGTRSGYGTSIVQIPLEPGEERTDVLVDMEVGVASISGRVIDENGQPLGGVAVTATSGEMTRTTTTLTSGNVGFYSIPGLDVPGTYTVTVDQTGFLPQTRRVPIGDSIGGINFALVRTTATLSGVVSSAGGGGIGGARVTLRNEDLEFDVSSAPAPQPGAFVVQNLPPGNYTVTFEHFNHQTATEFITIRPGVNPPPLLVTLDVRGESIDAGTGSLVLEIIDPTGETPEERQLTGATVELIENLTKKSLGFWDSASSTIEITKIPVGTYLVRVTGVPGYNDATRVVSIGQSQERREIEMFAIGAATGLMIDSFTREPITNYILKFFRQGEDTPWTEVRVIEEDGIWETEERVLPAGIYQLQVEGANGYEEPVDQVLQTGLPPMHIEILPGVEAPTQISTLEADRYPDIMGRVYEPRLLAGTQTEFDAIDNPDLEVQMSCGGDAVTIPLSDQFGLQPDSGDAFDTFFLPRQAVDANDLLGDCELVFSAPGYVTKTVDVPGVEIGDSNALSDRVVNVALVKPVESFGGRVFWIDEFDDLDVELPLAGVNIATEAVTELSPNLSGPLPPGQVPTATATPLSTTSNADGTWTLDGQIFGDASYTFSTPNFRTGVLDVVIDENQTRTVSEVEGLEVTQTSPSDYDVEMLPPDDGSISGVVTVLTTDPNTTAAEIEGVIEITAENPVGSIANVAKCAPLEPGLCIDRTGGVFSVTAATAGTWRTDYSSSDPNFVLFGSAPASVQQLLAPGGSRSGFDTTFVELGQIDVVATDARDNSDIRGGATLRLTGASGTREQPFGAQLTNVYSLGQIEVDDVDPVGTEEDYTLEIVIAGYDNTQATVTVDRDPTSTTDTLLTYTDATSIPLAIFAGSKPEIIVSLPPYGTVIAEALGDDGTADGEVLLPEDPDNPDPENDLEVRWTKLTDSFTEDPIDEALVSVERGPGPDQFQLRGPPGYYQIELRHPRYDHTSLTTPRDTFCDLRNDAPFCLRNVINNALINPPPAGVYVIENGTDNDLNAASPPDNIFELDVLTSTVTLEIRDSLVPLGSPLGDTDYTLTPMGDLTVSAISGVTDGAGLATIPVAPGVWELELRHYVDRTALDPVDDAFPVIVNFTVGQTTTSAPLTVAVRAPLVPLGGWVTGYLTAQNSRNGAVDFDPADPPVITNRAFAAPQPEVSGTTVPNEFTGDADVAGDGGAPTAAGSLGGSPLACGAVAAGQDPCRSFSINGLASGTHQLTFSVPDDYTFSSNSGDPVIDVVVTDTTSMNPTTTGPYVYTVEDIETVTLDIQGATTIDAFPNLSVLLRPPDGSADIVGTFTSPTPPAVPTGTVAVEFNDVPPYAEPYRLVVDSDLHQLSDSETRKVDVGPRETPVALAALTLVPDRGRVTGTIQTQQAGEDPRDLGAAGSITISGTGAPAAPGDTLSGQRGTYSFDVTASGTFNLLAQQTGFGDESRTPFITLGQQTTTDFLLRDQATLRVEIVDDIAGTVVQYVPRGGSAVAMTKTGTSGGNGVYTATVDGGGDYRIEVLPPTDPALDTLTGYSIPSRPAILLPGPDANKFYEDVDFGSTVPVGASVTIPRRIVVKVLPSSGNVTVDVSPLDTAPTQSASPNSLFVFTGSGGTGEIARTGTLDLRISRNNYRSVATTSGDLNDELIEVTLVQDIDFTGTVQDNATPTPNTVPSVDVSYTTADGATEADCLASALTIPADDSGQFTLADLTNESDGTPRTYLFCADEIGVGVGSVAQLVTGETPSADVTNAVLTLEPETIPVEFTLHDSVSGALITTANVSMDGDSDNTDGAGVATLSVAENGTRQYTIDFAADADYADVTATLPAYTTRTPTAAVSVTPKYVTKTINVQTTATSDDLEGATVVLSGGSFTSTPATTGADGNVTFSVPINAGDLSLSASAPDHSASGTLTLTDAEIRATTVPAETITLTAETVTVRIIVQDTNADPLTADTVVYPAGAPLTGSTMSNITTYTGVPVVIGGIADSATSEWSVALSGYVSQNGDITTTALRMAFETMTSLDVTVELATS